MKKKPNSASESNKPPLGKVVEPVPAGKPLTLMTYNIRVGLGDRNEGWYCLPEGYFGHLPDCARVIRLVKPDIVALQEVDKGLNRTGRLDQTAALATLTGLKGVFAGAIERDGGEYGVALLSKENPVAVRKVPLPGAEEKRVLLVAEFPDYVVCATHFSLTAKDQAASVPIIENAVKGIGKPVFLLGDFNTGPGSGPYAALEMNFVPMSGKHLKTFPSDKPDVTIDHVFLDRAHADRVVPVSASIPAHDPAASDHLPVVVKAVLLSSAP